MEPAQHPLPDEDLLAFLCGRLEEPAPLAGHLRACPECAGRAAALAELGQALDWAQGEGGPPSALTASRMKAMLPRRHPYPGYAAAAALLLALGGGLWISRREPSPPAVSPAEPASLAQGRLITPAPGAEVLLGQDAALVPQGEGWVLTQGACLAWVEGHPLRLSAGRMEVTIPEGEVLFRVMRPPWEVSWIGEASAEDPALAEVLVLSGSAVARSQGEQVVLSPGEAFSLSGHRRRVPAWEQAALCEAVLKPSAAALLGEPRVLQGSRGMDAWLVSPPASCYQVQVGLRVLEKPSVAGLSFVVDGQPTVWVPEDQEALADGRRHTLRAAVSPRWVTLLADGRVRHRVPREGFKPNTVQGISGLGAVAWGGRLEVSGFGVESWR